MKEGNLIITEALTNWLATQDKCLVVDLNSKGCNGNTIFWEFKKDACAYKLCITDAVHRLINNGLELKIDYIEDPLFQRIEIKVLNKNTCGCGVSFNV